MRLSVYPQGTVLVIPRHFPDQGSCTLSSLCLVLRIFYPVLNNNGMLLSLIFIIINSWNERLFPLRIFPCQPDCSKQRSTRSSSHPLAWNLRMYTANGYHKSQCKAKQNTLDTSKTDPWRKRANPLSAVFP